MGSTPLWVPLADEFAAVAAVEVGFPQYFIEVAPLSASFAGAAMRAAM